MRLQLFILPFVLLGSITYSANGQLKTEDGKFIMNAIIINGDTLPYKYLPQVTIVNPDFLALSPREKERYKRNLQRNRDEYARLRYNVYKTYPYAVMASYIVEDIDSAMLVIRSKDERKLYKRKKEEELMRQYKGELENLTITQGRVLVILIARQTGKDCYSIIKDMKGGFNARIWQTLAGLFSNNLKRNYDPEGEDASIEFICKEIEASGKYVRVNN